MINQNRERGLGRSTDHKEDTSQETKTRTGGEGLAEEVVGHVGHLAEDRQVRRALDLQPVRPGLAYEDEKKQGEQGKRTKNSCVRSRQHNRAHSWPSKNQGQKINKESRLTDEVLL